MWSGVPRRPRKTVMRPGVETAWHGSKPQERGDSSPWSLSGTPSGKHKTAFSPSSSNEYIGPSAAHGASGSNQDEAAVKAQASTRKIFEGSPLSLSPTRVTQLSGAGKLKRATSEKRLAIRPSNQQHDREVAMQLTTSSDISGLSSSPFGSKLTMFPRTRSLEDLKVQPGKVYPLSPLTRPLERSSSRKPKETNNSESFAKEQTTDDDSAASAPSDRSSMEKHNPPGLTGGPQQTVRLPPLGLETTKRDAWGTMRERVLSSDNALPFQKGQSRSFRSVSQTTTAATAFRTQISLPDLDTQTQKLTPTTAQVPTVGPVQGQVPVTLKATSIKTEARVSSSIHADKWGESLRKSSRFTPVKNERYPQVSLESNASYHPIDESHKHGDKPDPEREKITVRGGKSPPMSSEKNMQQEKSLVETSREDAKAEVQKLPERGKMGIIRRVMSVLDRRKSAEPDPEQRQSTDSVSSEMSSSSPSASTTKKRDVATENSLQNLVEMPNMAGIKPLGEGCGALSSSTGKVLSPTQATSKPVTVKNSDHDSGTSKAKGSKSPHHNSTLGEAFHKEHEAYWVDRRCNKVPEPAKHRLTVQDIVTLPTLPRTNTPEQLSSLPQENLKEPQKARSVLEEKIQHKPEIRLEVLRQHFVQEGKLTADCALLLLRQSSVLLRMEPNLLHVRRPVVVVGSLFGKVYDLLMILESQRLGGDPFAPQKSYIFLGNYTNFGRYGCETVLYLCALKILRPHAIILLRGGHDSHEMTQLHGFRSECLQKYSEEVYEAFIHFFNQLPLAAVIKCSSLCLSGGLSPEIHELAEIQRIYRFREPPPYGPMCDILWSAPTRNFDKQDKTCKVNFVHNDIAHRSYRYSFPQVSEFFNRNKLKQIVRSGDLCLENGHCRNKGEKIITIFSAASHAGQKNEGAVLKFSVNGIHPITVQCYKEFEQPFQLPGNLNAITWSLPVVAELSTQILQAIMKVAYDQDENDVEARWSKTRKTRILRKIRTMTTAIAFLRRIQEDQTQVMLSAVGHEKTEIEERNSDDEKPLKAGERQHEFIWLHEQEWSDSEGIPVPLVGDENGDDNFPVPDQDDVNQFFENF